MNEQQIQQAFIQYLAQKTGAKTQQELEQVIQRLGKDGIQKAYQEFMTLLQSQQVQSAKAGSKLDYVKQLRGKCPEGYEIEKYMSGGCVKCKKKQKGDVMLAMKEELKCGGKAKRIKKRK